MSDKRGLRIVMMTILLAGMYFLSRLDHRDGEARAQETNASATAPGDSETADPGIEIVRLANEGGIFMYPIYGLSLLAVAVIIERFLALRKGRVLPELLISSLGQLGETREGFDPKQAYKICQAYPSAAATVIRSMLLKMGRPHSEVEATVQAASEREATRLYGNVRWLNLCSTLAPLIGLLGTVQGMIIAFHRTTVIPVGANKALELANGIYTALVTTFGGLCVAIPAAFAAHYFEGRIQSLFLDIDNLLSSLLPQIERFEGRARFEHAEGGISPPAPVSTESGSAMEPQVVSPPVSPLITAPPVVSGIAVSSPVSNAVSNVANAGNVAGRPK